MRESADGFLRPVAENGHTKSSRDTIKQFNRVCPGRRVSAPVVEEGGSHHEIFGRYISVWRAWASDPEVREQGSSGGVLTALTAWLADTGQVTSTQAVAASTCAPNRSVSVRITTRQEALSAAGSRYAPVAALEGTSLSSENALVGKPCEIAAARAITSESQGSAPLMLSFFCAGTPSQHATDSLVRKLGLETNNLMSMRYRGGGWPGYFTAIDPDGREESLSYAESWGAHLGRDLQMRCKLCVDGTGEASDIAVGDFWETDSAGYPLFSEGDGESVAIARTHRGDDVIRRAAEAGVIIVEEVTLDDLIAVQPLQVKRRRTLAGRLLGRRLAGYRVPHYPGYSLAPHFTKRAVLNLRTAAGTFLRSVKSRVRGRSADR
ncbi:Coenzyme F420 hydrogenase/dehydrogenase, beta subunit C-terminal domain [Microbacterium amylolyticum]